MSIDWNAIGLTEAEYRELEKRLGREPNELEARMIGAMWSEHCSYKSTKRLLGGLPKEGRFVVQGEGENAGVVNLGDGLGIAFKVESHNHPSAVAPYDGAATGVGGVVRDIFAMGARPIACMAGLALGNPASPKVRELAQGMTAGINDYGRTINVPAIGGKTLFDSAYEGNPLVNAFCAGVVALDKIVSSQTAQAGEWGLLLGRATNDDGVGSASFASRELDEEGKHQTPRIPQGDPELENRLIEACLELRDLGLLTAMQDMGAAGLLSSSSEIAWKSGLGLDVFCDKLDLEGELAPWQIFLSETQERMFITIKKENWDAVKKIADRHSIPCAIIAETTPGDRYRAIEKGSVLADLPISLLGGAAPEIIWTSTPPADAEKRWQQAVTDSNKDANTALRALLASDSCTRAHSIWGVFAENPADELFVGADSPVGIVRVEGTQRLAAFAMDVDPWKCAADPRRGAAESTLQALRSLYICGAEALGLTDGLNFGSPEFADRFWELEESILGLSDAARALECPVVSGNVSLYNESKENRILPSPFIVAAGCIDSPNHYLGSGKWREGDLIFLVGSPAAELAGSRYAVSCLKNNAGLPSEMNAKNETDFRDNAIQTARDHAARSARLCGSGGLALALVKEVIGSGIGAALTIDPSENISSILFGEGGARAIYAVPAEKEAEFRKTWGSTPLLLLGKAGGSSLSIKNTLEITPDEINAVWRKF